MNKPSIKDKAVAAYVAYLEKKLAFYEKSPYKSTYIAITNQINDWNDQLKITGQSKQRVLNEGTEDELVLNYAAGKIDLFADKDAKEFERAFKYFLEAPALLKSLDELRNKMKPEELKQAHEQIQEGGVEDFVFNQEK